MLSKITLAIDRADLLSMGPVKSEILVCTFGAHHGAHPPSGCLRYLSECGQQSGQFPHSHGWATSGVFSNIIKGKFYQIQKGTITSASHI